MVGICQLTDSHHNHHGQKPTMVGICHGGNMLGNPDHHRFPHRHRRPRFLHRTNCCHCDRLQRVLPSSVGPVVELISAVGRGHLYLT